MTRPRTRGAMIRIVTVLLVAATLGLAGTAFATHDPLPHPGQIIIDTLPGPCMSVEELLNDPPCTVHVNVWWLVQPVCNFLHVACEPPCTGSETGPCTTVCGVVAIVCDPPSSTGPTADPCNFAHQKIRECTGVDILTHTIGPKERCDSILP